MAANASSVPDEATHRLLRKRKSVSYLENDSDDNAENTAQVEDDYEEDWASLNRAKPNQESESADTNNGRSRKKARLNERKNGLPGSRFRFLDLPAELRNEIYQLALIDPDKIMLGSTTFRYRRLVKRGQYYATSTPRYGEHTYQSAYPLPKEPEGSPDHPHHPPKTPLSPQLLRVCKQIHNEATPFLYGQVIMFHDTMAMHDFLSTIGLHHQKHLTHLVLKGWGRRGMHKAANHYAFSLLQDASALQEFSIDCWLGWMMTPKRAAVSVFRAAHHFFERCGTSHGGKDAVLDVLRMHHTVFTPSWYGRREKMPEKSEQNMVEFRDELRRLLLRS